VAGGKSPWARVEGCKAGTRWQEWISRDVLAVQGRDMLAVQGRDVLAVSCPFLDMLAAVWPFLAPPAMLPQQLDERLLRRSGDKARPHTRHKGVLIERPQARSSRSA
jgi:hypothetical protein